MRTHTIPNDVAIFILAWLESHPAALFPIIFHSLDSVWPGNNHGWKTAQQFHAATRKHRPQGAWNRIGRPVPRYSLRRIYPEAIIKFAFEHGYIEEAMLAKQALYE